jgi:magnesium transporter
MSANPLHNSPTSMELYEFGENFFQKHHIKTPEDVKPFLTSPHKFWLNVSSLENEELLRELSPLFDIHPLTLEDVLNCHQRPKFEEFETNIFIVSKMVYYLHSKKPKTEQISIFIGKNYVLTIQENAYDFFDPIRVRLENPNGKMRKLGPDYFAYTLIDAIVDKYFDIIEKQEDMIDKMEDQIVSNTSKQKLSTIFQLRKEIQHLKKIIWPTRELLSNWKKSESSLLKRKTDPFINDVYEHIIEVNENLEVQRESIATLVEMFLSSLSIKQNEVMKTLTIIATIFIPLTFIAGVYGMNFQFMPELSWKYGYLLIWIIFAGTTAAMIRYFKQKDWF